MTRILPQATDTLNNPGHSFLHRVVSVDTNSPQSSIDIDASGNVSIPSLVVTSTRGAAVTTQTANYNILSTDDLILGNAANIILILPSAVGLSGKTYTIKKIDETGTFLRVQATGAELIDGTNTPYDLFAQYTTLVVRSDGSKWWIL